MIRSENKTLREKKKEKIKERDERFLYTRWPKSSLGLDFGRSLTSYGSDPASLSSTASKAASLDSTASKGATAAASKGAPVTALKAHRPQPRRALRRGARSVSWFGPLNSCTVAP